MASSRDDFIIAIRSAFLKKSTQQKFSLLTLVFFSIVIIVLSSFNLKAITLTKSFIKEIVYRSSFIISIPENFLKSSYHVKDLKLCSIRLHDNLKFPWLILIPRRKNITDMSELNSKDQILLMKEIVFVSKIMKKLFVFQKF